MPSPNNRPASRDPAPNAQLPLPDTGHVPETVRITTPPRRRLPTRVCLLSLASLLVVLTMIAGNLYVPWTPEGAGAAIACMGTMTVLYLWIILQDPAARVTHKTAELARQNRDLESLYDLAAFLNHANEANALARGFLERVMQRFGADGGTVRMFDAQHGMLHRLASIGLPSAQAEHKRCASIDACHCGHATRSGFVSITDLRAAASASASSDDASPCGQDGLLSMAAFRLDTQRGPVGTFTLHFRAPRELSASDRQLLKTMAQHLATSLEHVRRTASARQLAVMEERNLVAQGLHDSIAQGLNFLNLQVQLLDAAVELGNADEVREIVPMLRHGVEESYQDVRELLHNFRSRLTTGDMRPAVEETVSRFRRQCRTEPTLTIEDRGLPLQPEQQLQVLFILQEALSNVRKHAMAETVRIVMQNDTLFRLVVQDDGDGFEPTRLGATNTGHVGLHIMQERAARLGATLAIDASPGQGTRIELILLRSDIAPPHHHAARPAPQRAAMPEEAAS